MSTQTKENPMAVGATFVNGKTGEVTATDVAAALGGPIEVAESTADAADLWTALEALGLVVEPA
jgi:hypothetical protein